MNSIFLKVIYHKYKKNGTSWPNLNVVFKVKYLLSFLCIVKLFVNNFSKLICKCEVLVKHEKSLEVTFGL